MRNKSIVLFDLDGTLMDTSPDLHHALNILRERYDLAPISFETFHPYTTFGIPGFLEVGFNLSTNHPDYPQLYPKMSEEFRDIYQDHCLNQKTRPFPGVQQLIEGLDELNHRWGIVTNKPIRFAKPLVESYDFMKQSACLISAHELDKLKPDPTSLLHACRLLDCHPEDCLYVGDSMIDVKACQNAKMKMIAVSYGYHLPDEDPKSWQTNHLVDRPEEILEILTIAPS